MYHLPRRVPVAAVDTGISWYMSMVCDINQQQTLTTDGVTVKWEAGCESNVHDTSQLHVPSLLDQHPTPHSFIQSMSWHSCYWADLPTMLQPCQSSTHTSWRQLRHSHTCHRPVKGCLANRCFRGHLGWWTLLYRVVLCSWGIITISWHPDLTPPHHFTTDCHCIMK